MALLVSEEAVAALEHDLDIEDAVRRSYVVAASGDHLSAPVLPWRADHGGGNIKWASIGDLVGGKLGTYWPANAARGAQNHAATTILLDPESGYPRALLSARLLNRWRTAAGNGVATQILARPDAQVLAVIGGGAQALFEARAVAAVRPIREIRFGLRNPAAGDHLAAALEVKGCMVRTGTIEQAIRGADIIATATPSREPLFAADWVTEGAHISAMGADAVGKRELPAELLDRAELWCDWEVQSRTIGEFQHAPAGLPVRNIGEALAHARFRRSGRTTVFDSSGLALQDLFADEAALAAGRARGLACEIAL